MASSSSPCGLLIGRSPRTLNYKIGKEIGSGVCGAVYELIDVEDPSKKDFVIKAAVLGDPNSTGKKQKELRHHSNLLYYEHLLYVNHLASLRGEYIPQVPISSGPPPAGTINGFRYLVMERMEGPLIDGVVKELSKKTTSSSKKNDDSIASVAVQLIDLIEAIHDKHHVAIDIKPDNFMLAKPGTSSKKKTLASRIRMIDLGLLQPIGSVSGGHRANEGISQLVGTPLYCSLNVHELAKPSRRDDVESIGYVLCELLLRLNGIKALPWAKGGSDQAIYKLKQECLEKKNSVLWKNLAGNAKVMQSYFDHVRGLGYKHAPDYDFLRGLLEKLQLTAPAAAAKKAAAAATTPSKAKSAAASTRRDTKASTTATTAGAAAARTTRSTRARGAKRASPTKDDDGEASYKRTASANEESEDEEEDEFVTPCGTESNYQDTMEWQIVERPAGVKPNAKSLGLKFECIDGPHEGESFYMLKGENETMTLGLTADFSLTCDSNVDATHATLTLHASKKLKTIVVKDNKSSTGTFVNGKPLGRGKEQKLFISDTFQVGDSTFKVLPIPASELVDDDDEEEDNENKAPNERATATGDLKKKAAARQYESDVSMMEESSEAEEEPMSKGTGFGVQLEFISGPYKGDCIILEQGDVESVVLGAKPRSKKSANDELFPMSQDLTIKDDSHVRFELNTATTSYCTVIVTDLKSTVGTTVNKNTLGKGKNQKAFLNDQVTIGDSVLQLKKL